MEIIRDAITHPITTITDTIENVFSSSSTEPTVSVSNEEEKPDSTPIIDHDHTTLDTIREVITHPITSISEKIHSLISPTHDDQIEQISSSDTLQSSPPSSEQITTVNDRSIDR